MADAVYLHIGAPKTGTSYVQRMLWRNKDALAERGIFLPLGRRRAHFDAAADLRGGMWAADPLSASWDGLVEDILARDGIAVVSEELFCGTPEEQIQRVVSTLAPVPVHVIHAARDIGRQVPAEWQQSLRARSVMGYSDWLGKLTEPDRPFWNIQDPTIVFKRWADHLPNGHFHVLTVPPKGSPPALLWERFCGIVGADPAKTSPLEGAQNESFGVIESELLRRFNMQLGSKYPMRNPYIKMVRDYVMRPALMGAPGAIRIGVPEQYHSWITERAAQMVADLEAIADRVDIVGAASDLHASIETTSLAPDDVTETQLLDAALAAWTRQLEFLETEVDERNAEERRRRKARARARKRQAELDRTLKRRVRRKLGAVKRRVLGQS